MGTFINSEEKFVPLSEREFARLQGAAEIVKQDDREYYKIDDMLFPRDVLDVKGGFLGHIWTDSKVYYEFDASVTDANRTNFLNAASEWADVTNIVFIERSDQANFIHVQPSDTENSSSVGMIGGKQTLKITSWDEKFVVAHEIGHALGLMHEHTRGDRDTFVYINTENIIDDKAHNFVISSTSNYTRYDFSSIMHYDRFAFSKNGLPTIKAQPGYESEGTHMGNRSYLTSRDAAAMYIRYGRP